MTKKLLRFHLEDESYVHALDKPETTEQQAFIETLYANGAYHVWRHLKANIIRSLWKDHKGYPIKEKYYDTGLLAACVSTRKLASMTGLCRQKLLKTLDALQSSGWISICNKHALKGQNVYILGYWSETVDENGESKYNETLYYDEINSGKRACPCFSTSFVVEDDVYEEYKILKIG